ncbi:MAG: DUF4428 domain-containing protein [Treponema sp.]|nr:DUF4428 domain-containing protein [Treponema sp.]
MGLFEKKYCDFCGEKIGLLGNRKLEDGNMCKNCAAKLSPWFNERRHSTKADIQAQLEYREQNKSLVAAFNATQTLGNDTRLLIDEGARKFMVTRAKDLQSANPDVLDFSQAVGCDLDIQEDKTELKQEDSNGNSTSYNPPRYEYSYSFEVRIRVSSPYFDEMSFDLSNGYITTGEKPMNPSMQQESGGWNLHSSDGGYEVNKYFECVKIGNAIKEAIERMKNTGGSQAANVSPAAAQQAEAAREEKVCPGCGAKTFPNQNGCCEYCGSAL